MHTRFLLGGWLMVALQLCGQAQLPERIFYSSFSPQDWDIFLSTDGGKSVTVFSDHPALDYDAVISPDGQWVVFTSERSGTAKLYAQPVYGDRQARLLLDSPSFQDQAAFSPDGAQLAFVATHEGNAEVYVMAFLPDSTQYVSAARNVTNHAGGDFRPSFSPDGKHLAFSSDRGHAIGPHPQFPFARQRIGDIYTVELSGGRVKRLTDTASWDGSPTWSADGSSILFYSERTGTAAVHTMHADGSGQQQLFEYPGPVVSPRYLSANAVVFTTWSSERDFRVMQVDLSTGDITPLVSSGPELMFHADVHPNGIMVFHGGKAAKGQEAPGRFGFDGDVLAKLPDSLRFADRLVNLYGVRRAFVAPPQPGNTMLVYDAGDVQDFGDALRPLGYTVFLLPLVVAVVFIAVVVSGLRHRKKISGWKYVLLGIVTLITGVVAGGVFLQVDAIDPRPVPVIRTVMGGLAVVMFLLGWWQYRAMRRKKEQGVATHRVSALYTGLFMGLAVFAVCCAVFINHMVHSTLNFYQVDYRTGERKWLFALEKEAATNPANFSVLDSKVTPDGRALVFTTGSFRAGPDTQGDIWRYHFATGDITKLSDSPANDGFGEWSESGEMVFRSGRSGYFDIYLQTEDTVVNLTADHHRDNFPSISRQGDQVVFSSDRLKAEHDYKTMDIFRMRRTADASWTAPEKISSGEGQHAHAHFSPDGEWVVYTTESYGINDEQPLVQPIIFSPQMYGEIVAYHLSTGERIRLTHNKWEDGTPLWVD